MQTRRIAHGFSTLRTLIRTSLFSGLLMVGFAAPTALVGCGGGQNEVKTANVKPGTMPSGGEWRGVYYSPTYGFLHLEAAGNSINGAWRTGGGEKWGELHGTAEGNLLRYEWTEHTIGLVGEGAQRQGKGYFVYKIPREGEAHEIHGQWGLGDSDAQSSWDAIKQINREPDLASVKPDEIEGRVQAGGWDEEGGGASEEGGGEEEEDTGSDDSMGGDYGDE